MGINLGEIRERSTSGYDQDTVELIQRILHFKHSVLKKNLHVIWVKKLGVS